MKKAYFETTLYYLFLIVVFLTPFAMIYTLNSDGANHSEVAEAMVHLWRGDCAVVTKWWTFNPILVPNWTGYLIMAALIVSGASALFAEKFLIGLCLIGPVWAFRFLAKRLWPDNWRVVSWLGFFLSTNTLILDSGTYSFGLCLVAIILGIRFYWEWHTTRSRKALVGLACCATLGWFTHLFSFLALLLIVGAHELLVWARYNRFSMRYFRMHIVCVLAFVPGCIFTALYAMHLPPATISVFVQNAHSWKSIGLIIVQFIAWTIAIPARGYFQGEQLLAVCSIFASMTFTSLFILVKDKIYTVSNLALISAGLFLILMFVVPFSEGIYFGGWYVGHRLSTLAYILLLIVCGYTLPRYKNAFTFFLLGALVVPGFLLYAHVTKANAYLLSIQKFVPSTHIVSNSTYGALITDVIMRRDGHENACFVDYPVHQLSRLFKLDKCSVNRSNFMGTYHTFPLIFKDVITGKPVRGVDYVLVMSQKRKITCDKDIVLGDYILTSEDNLEKCEKAKELFLSTRKTKLFKKELCESIDVGVYRMHPKSGH